MSRAHPSLGIRLPAFFRPWLVLPALLFICIQTAWLGVRLAAGAAPQAAGSDLLTVVAPIGDAASHMTSSNCATCHQTTPVLSHPVNVMPTLAVPAEFPLVNGQVDCVTCHRDTFADHASAAVSRGGDGAMLRGSATGQAFCAECHTEGSLSRQSQHPLARQAHLLWPKSSSVATANPAGKQSDGVSSCLACHDGTVAQDAFGGLMATSTGGATFNANGMLKGHPVGVAYPTGTLRHGDAVFHPVVAVDARIRLTGGNVTCNSCHSLYSREAGLLVMRNDNSALCMSCHAQ